MPTLKRRRVHPDKRRERQRKPTLDPDWVPPDLGPAMYEISWPQKRWINLGQITQWYELAQRNGHLLDADRAYTIAHDMVQALARSGCLILTGKSK